MKDNGIMYWESYLEALERTEQYILNSLKLVQLDINSCKKRIEIAKKSDGLTIAEAMNYRPYDGPHCL